jgi:hypothetical protein
MRYRLVVMAALLVSCARAHGQSLLDSCPLASGSSQTESDKGCAAPNNADSAASVIDYQEIDYQNIGNQTQDNQAQHNQAQRTETQAAELPDLPSAHPENSTSVSFKTPSDSVPAPSASSRTEREGFHWRRALEESGTFLLIEQAWVVHTDFRWVVSENGIPFNHYWRDYAQSLDTWWHAGWSAGENPMYNYVGHPIQGAITGNIELQNNPKDRAIEFSNSKIYWKSRLKATLWNTVYSTQWSIGPISEMTVEKYGSEDRQPWNANGTYPCDTSTCYWGVGKVNLVMTPVGGLGWMIAEDWMDKNIVRRVEARTTNHLLVDTVRCTFNPIRGGANILHGNKPWFRPRDVADWQSPAQRQFDR